MAARKKKRADGRYRVTLTYEDAQGTKRRQGFYGRTQAEANAKRQEARERLAAGGPIRDASCTLAEWLEEWRGTFLATSDRATATKSLYSGLCARWIVPTIGHVRLDHLRASDVVRLMQTMEAAGKAASTRRNAYAALRGALEDAHRNDLILNNPVSKVPRPRVSQTEALCLDPEQVARFLMAADSLRYVDALRLILGTDRGRRRALPRPGRAVRRAGAGRRPGRPRQRPRSDPRRLLATPSRDGAGGAGKPRAGPIRGTFRLQECAPGFKSAINGEAVVVIGEEDVAGASTLRFRRPEHASAHAISGRDDAESRPGGRMQFYA
jgi:hypothetical protein